MEADPLRRAPTPLGHLPQFADEGRCGLERGLKSAACSPPLSHSTRGTCPLPRGQDGAAHTVAHTQMLVEQNLPQTALSRGRACLRGCVCEGGGERSLIVMQMGWDARLVQQPVRPLAC